jgi:hypothetical protein
VVAPHRTGGCAILLEDDRAAFVEPEVAEAIVHLAEATNDATEAAETLREHGATVQVDIDCELDVGLQADELTALEDER